MQFTAQDKAAGNPFTHDEFNALKQAVNSKRDISPTLSLLGFPLVMQSYGVQIPDMTVGSQLVATQLRLVALDYLTADAAITALTIYMQNSPSYSGDGGGENTLTLYKLNGANLEKVATTASSPSLYPINAAQTFVSIPLTATYQATPGQYFIGILFNSATVGTVPFIGAASNPLQGIASVAKIYGYLGGVSVAPATIPLSSINAQGTKTWGGARA